MSAKRTVSSSSKEGKGGPIGSPATSSAIADKVNPEAPASSEDIFALASKLEALLKGQSNKTCLKVMNMVGSLHGIQAVPVTRPLGRSTTGTTRVEPVVKPKKGLPTPKASWKQSESYRSLSAERDKIVKTIKSAARGDPSIEGHVQELRGVEQKLKDLRGLRAGEC